MEMKDVGDRLAEAALWRRWRAEQQAVPRAGAAPGALWLAAYADGRLDEANIDAVEAWLADDPVALDDAIAARRAVRAALPDAPEAMIARAADLVAPGAANVVPLRPRAPQPRRAWRTAFAWSGIAASLLVTSLFGFTLGSNAYLDLAQQQVATDNVLPELLDPPTTLFTPEEDSAI
jgi:anti-sigma factor RsiW